MSERKEEARARQARVLGWCVCVGLWLGGGLELGAEGERKKGPFDALDGVIERVEVGLARWQKGEPLEKAMMPLQPKIRPRMYPQTLEAIQKAGVRSWQFFAMEFELLLQGRKGKPQYLRTLIHPHRRGWKLFEAGMRDSFSAVQGDDLSAYKGTSEPLRRAGWAFYKHLVGRDCASLPFADLRDLPPGFPEKEKRKGERKLGSLPQRWERICQEIQRRQIRDVRLRVDDIAVFGFDRWGKLVGMLRLEWRLGTKGELVLKVGSFRSLVLSPPTSAPSETRTRAGGVRP